MKLHLLQSALIALTLIFSGCSIDDEDVQDTNGFVLDGAFRPTPAVYIDALDVEQNPDGSTEDAISIILSSAFYMDTPGTIDPLDYVLLKVKMTDLAAQQNIPTANYYFGIDGYSSGGAVLDAVTVLWRHSTDPNLTAVEKNVTINYVSASQIDLTYSFKRMDGKVIYGQYVGPYISLN